MPPTPRPTSGEAHAGRVDGSADVVARAKRGERDAVEAIFRVLDPDLRRYLTSAERDAADDLLGEVWLGVARSFSAFEGDLAALRAWVFTIAQRRLIDLRRRRAFRQTDVTDPRRLPLSDEPGADEEVLAELDGQDAASRVRALLSADQADVVLLRVLGQFEVGEVAAIMGRSDNWVRVTEHRGLRRLADRMHPRGAAQ